MIMDEFHPKLDCPICGRKNVSGIRKEDKPFVGAVTLLAGVAGAIVGGPAGALAGGIIGSKLSKYADKSDNERSGNGNVYIFNCPNPNCRHHWTANIKL